MFYFQSFTDNVVAGGFSPKGFIYVSFLSMAMHILVALFIRLPILERTSGAKHLQLMTGVSPATFWMSNLCWDFLIFSISAMLMIGLLMVMDYEHTFTSFEAPGLYCETF